MPASLRPILSLRFFFSFAGAATSQGLPAFNMSYSGAGIGVDLLKVIERAGL